MRIFLLSLIIALGAVLPVSASEKDTDTDGLPDLFEIKLGTDLHNKDSDGDGFFDWEELKNGYNPLQPFGEKLEKRIEVQIATQELAYYVGDIKIDSFKISSGKKGWDTPKGTFVVLKKHPIVRYKGAGYDYPHTKWNLMFKYGKKGNYYIHGAYWHNKFGTRRSHGCVNVAYKNMERLYEWAHEGEKIFIK